jgi:putative peptidoglycan lipid II flippase
MALGDSVITLLYQTGKFTRDNAEYVWAVLGGYSVGLQAATLGRLYTSAFWAMRDTRTPLKFAAIRVALAAGLGWVLAFPVSHWIGIPARFGLVGLTLAAGIAAWIEFALLRSSMNRQIGKTGLPVRYAAQLWSIAIAAVLPAYAVKYGAAGMHPLVSGILVLFVYGLAYVAAAAIFKLPEATQLLAAIRSGLKIGD